MYSCRGKPTVKGGFVQGGSRAAHVCGADLLPEAGHSLAEGGKTTGGEEKPTHGTHISGGEDQSDPISLWHSDEECHKEI
jgi:hypothetical protein